MKLSRHMMVVFRQLFEKESSTYTYILGCEKTKKCVIIDPVLETAERDAQLVKELNLEPIYALNTHVHADHVTGTTALKSYFPSIKSCVAAASGGESDVQLVEGETVKFGEESLEVRSTPGHTNGCVTYVDKKNEMAFTGDALLIRGCGRTDFQQGDARSLYKTVWKNILSLPDHFKLYVGHNYEGLTVTTVWEEKKYNKRLTKTEDEFVDIMDNLNLPYPKQIDRALPENLRDGKPSAK